jgi:competence protein ComEC
LDLNIQRESRSLATSSTLAEPLIPLLLGVISGILFGNHLAVDWRIALAACAASFALWVLAVRRPSTYAHWVAGAAVIFWLATARTSYIQSEPLPSLDAGLREVIAVDACVVSLPDSERDRLLFWAEIAPDARMRVSWYLGPDDKRPALRYGERYRLHVRAKPIRNAGNQGVFDAERYMRHRKIFWNASIVSRFGIERLPGNCGNPAQAAIYSLRAYLLHRIALLAGTDSYLRAMLGALLLGDNSQLERAWIENYRKTGTYHAIVVSGLHLTVLAAALGGLLRLLFVPRNHVLLLCSVLAVAYALVCDLSAPVVRAAGGFLLYSLAQFFYRKARPLNLLAAVAIAYLLVDPEQLYEGSFQLSFLAVLALCALAGPLQERLSKPWSAALYRLEEAKFRPKFVTAAELRVELRLATGTLARLFRCDAHQFRKATRLLLYPLVFSFDLLLTSAVVLVGLSLPTVLFFHRLNFASLTANLPVVVLLSLGVVAGFLALILGPIAAPPLSALLYASRRVVDWHLSWDTSGRVPDPPIWLMLSLPIALLAAAVLARYRMRWSVLPAMTALALFFYLALHPFDQEAELAAGRLEITALDIGQGDSLLLATPSRHLAILDGGGARSDRFDPGESILSPYLWSRHIQRIDTLIASHGDLDHIGGLLAAFDNFQPRQLWVSHHIHGPLWEKLRTRAQGRIRYLEAGDQVDLGGLAVEVLWPPKGASIDQPNLASLVLLLRHGRHRFLLTGDIDSSVESALLDAGRLGKIDVLKVAHHGSKTSSSEAFLDRTRPSVSLISAGWANPFGHPHGAVLRRLEDRHSLVLRTDRLGQIRVLSDGKRLQTEIHAYREPGYPLWLPLTTALE